MKFRPFRSREALAWFIAAVLAAALVYQHVTLRQAMEQAPVELGIDQLIAQVKADLEAAERTRLQEGKVPLFKVDTFDLEIHFAVRRSASSEAGARLEVVTLSGKTDVAAEKTQKITLHMKTIDYGNGGGSMPGSSGLIPVR